jgi:translin
MIEDVERIADELASMQKRMDGVMELSRLTVRLSAQGITALHSKDMKKADSLLTELKASAAKLKKIEKGFEYYSEQAHQEYVEAMALSYVIRKGRLPAMKEIGAEPRAYILGIMDLVGELKREAYDLARKGDYGAAERYYELMRDIYDSTLHIRFANAVLQNFRKKQDVARIQLESVANLITPERRSANAGR